MFVYIATKVRSQLRERAGTRVFVYLYVYINEKYTLSEGFTFITIRYNLLLYQPRKVTLNVRK